MSTKRLQWLLLLMIVCLSLLLKILAITKVQYMMGDGAEYLIGARNLYRGRGFITDIDFRENSEHLPAMYSNYPLWPFMIALFSFLTRNVFFAGNLLAALFSTLAVVAVFLFSKILLNECYGNSADNNLWAQVRTIASPNIIIAAIIAFHPKLFLFSTVPYTDVPYLALTILAFLILEKNILNKDKPRLSGLCVLGCICAAALLLRGTGVVLLPAVLLTIILRKGIGRSSLYLLIVIVLVFFTCVAPYLIYNLVYFSDPLFSYRQVAEQIHSSPISVGTDSFIEKIQQIIEGFLVAFNPRSSDSLFRSVGQLLWLGIAGAIVILVKLILGSKTEIRGYLVVFIFALLLLLLLSDSKLINLYGGWRFDYRHAYPIISCVALLAVYPLSQLCKKPLLYLPFVLIFLLLGAYYLRQDINIYRNHSFGREPRELALANEYLKQNLNYEDTLLLSSAVQYFSWETGLRGYWVYQNSTFNQLMAKVYKHNITHVIIIRWDKNPDVPYGFLLDIPVSEIPSELKLLKEFRDGENRVRIFTVLHQHRDLK